MTVGVMTGSFTLNAVAAARKVDVWDFGAIAQDGDMYANHITADQLDSLTFVADGGKFDVGVANTAVDCDFGNDLTVAALTNDRLFYTGGAGTKNYGTLPAHGSMAYPDGYTAGVNITATVRVVSAEDTSKLQTVRQAMQLVFTQTQATVF
jgi:hypothetical protein